MAKVIEQLVAETIKRFRKGGAGGPKALMMDPAVTIFPALQVHEERMSFVDPAVAIQQPQPIPLPAPTPEVPDLITPLDTAPMTEVVEPEPEVVEPDPFEGILL